MKSDYRCYIEHFRYRDSEFDHSLLIDGWALRSGKEITSYKVIVNGNEVACTVHLVLRKDVMQTHSDLNPMGALGFHIEVANVVNAREVSLLACSDEEEVIHQFHYRDLLKAKNTSNIELFIDEYIYDEHKKELSVLGWALSLNQENPAVFYEIQKDGKTIETTYDITKRIDLLTFEIVGEKNIHCGFRIVFTYDENENYTLVASNGVDTKEMNIDYSLNENIIKSYAKNMNSQRIQNAWRYLQRKGLKSFIGRLLKGPNNGFDYNKWMLEHRIKESVLEEQRKHVFDYNPKISVIVATFNTKDIYLKEMIDTCLYQSYPNWELCIADGSKDNSVLDYIKENYADERIKVKKLDKNYGISGNMNGALSIATGDYVGLYDHDDFFELDAFYEIVSSLQDYRYDVVYSDEDKFDDVRKVYMDPYFKPDFNIDLLRSGNYVTHFLCVSMDLIREVGSLKNEYDGAQDLDFMLRCSEKANGIHHIQKILYHWRMHPLSTAQDPKSKMYCYEAGMNSVQAHLDRLGIPANVEIMPEPLFGCYRTKYLLDSKPLVSIIVYGYKNNAILEKCLNSIRNSSYTNYEIIVVDKKNTEHDRSVRSVLFEQTMANTLNKAVKEARGECILFLHGNLVMVDKTSIEEMVGNVIQKNVGCVGSKILYENGIIYSGGMIVGCETGFSPAFKGCYKYDNGYMLRSILSGDFSAVTGECMMVKKSLFVQVGGFDTSYISVAYDIDLCLRFREKEFVCVYNAFSTWTYLDKKINFRQEMEPTVKKDMELFKKNWSSYLEKGDPFYNKNFNKENAPFELS